VLLALDGPTPRLFVRRLDGTALRAVPETDGAWQPALSPDGTEVAFFTARALRRTALGGGPAVTLAETSANQRGIAWLADGSIVFAAQPLVRARARAARRRSRRGADDARPRGRRGVAPLAPRAAWRTLRAVHAAASTGRRSRRRRSTRSRSRRARGGACWRTRPRRATRRQPVLRPRRAPPGGALRSRVAGPARPREVVADGVRFDCATEEPTTRSRGNGTVLYVPAPPVSTDTYVSWVDTTGRLAAHPRQGRCAAFRDPRSQPGRAAGVARPPSAAGAASRPVVWSRRRTMRQRLTRRFLRPRDRLSGPICDRGRRRAPPGVRRRRTGAGGLTPCTGGRGLSRRTHWLHGDAPHRLYPNAWDAGRAHARSSRRTARGHRMGTFRMVDVGRAAAPQQRRRPTRRPSPRRRSRNKDGCATLSQGRPLRTSRYDSRRARRDLRSCTWRARLADQTPPPGARRRGVRAERALAAAGRPRNHEPLDCWHSDLNRSRPAGAPPRLTASTASSGGRRQERPDGASRVDRAQKVQASSRTYAVAGSATLRRRSPRRAGRLSCSSHPARAAVPTPRAGARRRAQLAWHGARLPRLWDRNQPTETMCAFPAHPPHGRRKTKCVGRTLRRGTDLPHRGREQCLQ
jgi:hypothetical protein